MADDFAPKETQGERDGRFAEMRHPDRTYVSKTTTRPGLPGVPARFVHKVFDPESGSELEISSDGTEWTVSSSPLGRHQVKLLVSRESGHVSQLWLQRVVYAGTVPRAANVFNLSGDDARRLVELLKAIEGLPVEGGETIRVDDAVLHAVLSSPENLSELYARDPEAFRRLITDDRTGRDLVALSRRRSEVERFKRLIDDDAYFDAQVIGGHQEEVWQQFFEANPWILGTGLGGQLYTSWDETRLQQVVGGASIAREGKRADALMRTSGVVRWMTFAEFKTHRTDLVSVEYRPGTWSPSPALVGGVAQAQATVRRAMQEIDDAIRATAADGAEIPNEVTFLTRPRSFLVVGRLDELIGRDGGPHVAKVRSFELFRRGLVEPEIVTFDELLARAEWVVDLPDVAVGPRGDGPAPAPRPAPTAGVAPAAGVAARSRTR